MSFLVSSAPSSNPSLASSLGNNSKGRLLIKFPFPLDSGWYKQQTCTIFRTFEHRRERQGFRHEFILLKLLDGSVCRIERMGDPNARFDAISAQGSIAYDIAQSFQPDEMDKACLGTSDVIAEVTLPCDFDIMDVLKICRAIHEGEKTRKYTLQVYNCWFFSLAVQGCLARLIAGWESLELLDDWLWHTYEVAKSLDLQDQRTTIPGPLSYLSRTLRIYDILTSHNITGHYGTAIEAVKLRLLSHLACRREVNRQRLAVGINDLLWYSSILSSLGNMIEENVKEVVIDVLQERFLAPVISNPDVSSPQSLEQLKYRALAILTELLCLAVVEMPEPLRSTLWSPKQRLTHQINTTTRSEFRTNQLSFNGIYEEQLTQITGGWHPSQWINQCLSYLGCFFLWLLYTVSITSGVALICPWVEPTLCVIIEQQLENMVAELEHLDIITHVDLERHIAELRALTENGDAIWVKKPWNGICRFIGQRVTDTISKSGKVELICFKPKEQSKIQGAVGFQAHVLDRIRIHAKEVEKKWLGSALHIQTELEDVLSQVWKMIREDDIIPKWTQPITNTRAPSDLRTPSDVCSSESRPQRPTDLRLSTDSFVFSHPQPPLSPYSSSALGLGTPTPGGLGLVGTNSSRFMLVFCHGSSSSDCRFQPQVSPVRPKCLGPSQGYFKTNTALFTREPATPKPRPEPIEIEDSPEPEERPRRIEPVIPEFRPLPGFRTRPAEVSRPTSELIRPRAL
ncbi:unnamed protein product [Rhizoctonia solani]|uniref:Uncharacterized protein n=1 Tax=Rhizoctonia solani TaxID=456999 RepID=A0A8H3EBG1_9AGAM|nr:unnamed protein product [Rhizoctonia solani]